MVYRIIQNLFRKIIEDKDVDGTISNSLGYYITFYYSTPNEFITIVGESKNAKFPFIYINSLGVSLTDEILTVKDLIIATKSDQNWDSETRDNESFEPYLTPILEELIHKVTYGIGGLRMTKKGKIQYHYFFGKDGNNGYEGHKFTQPIDAIQLTDFSFKISRNCLN